MVVANHERLQRCLLELRDGLKPYCERVWSGFYGQDWLAITNGSSNIPTVSPPPMIWLSC